MFQRPARPKWQHRRAEAWDGHVLGQKCCAREAVWVENSGSAVSDNSSSHEHRCTPRRRRGNGQRLILKKKTKQGANI